MKNRRPNKIENPDLRFAILATDIALFTLRENELCIRLIPVNKPPHFENMWGLPGGLLSPAETAEEAAHRHLETKAKIVPSLVHLEQLYTFSEVQRDPRGRVVAVAYLAVVPWESLSVSEREENDKARWVPITKLPKLAYDHDTIVSVALERLRSRISYTTLIAKLLPQEFTLIELERAYETILKKKIDRRNFRKKIEKLELVRSLGRKRQGLKSRPAMLYSFRSTKVTPIDIL